MVMPYVFYYLSILVLRTPSDAHAQCSVFRVLRRFEWTFNLRIASPLCWSLNPLSSSDTNFFISDTVDRFCRFYNNNRIFFITAELAQVTVSSPGADGLRSSRIRCMGHKISVRGKREEHAREQILRVLPSRIGYCFSQIGKSWGFFLLETTLRETSTRVKMPPQLNSTLLWTWRDLIL